MLKVVSVNNPQYYDIMDRMGSRDSRLDNNPWWYLHGELERDLVTDQAIIYNMTDHPELQKEVVQWKEIGRDMIARVSEIQYYKSMYFTGTIDVEVLGRPDRPCIGYFWVADLDVARAISKRGVSKKFHIWKQRGYVVYADDRIGLEQVKEMYEKGRAGYETILP